MMLMCIYIYTFDVISIYIYIYTFNDVWYVYIYIKNWCYNYIHTHLMMFDMCIYIYTFDVMIIYIHIYWCLICVYIYIYIHFFVYKMCAHFTQRMSLHSKSAPKFSSWSISGIRPCWPRCRMHLELGKFVNWSRWALEDHPRGIQGDQGIIWGW